MRTTCTQPLAPLAAALLIACTAEAPTDGAQPGVEPRFSPSTDVEWSAPVNLGPVVNSPNR